MKTKRTRIILTGFFFYMLLIMFSVRSYSQPDYYFNNGSLVSGTDRQIGAQYLYKNVKPGVDAFVTISDITPGVSVDSFDAGSGYQEALQPTIRVAGNTKGYVEMKFQFVIGGTSIPMVQLEIPATCIDVDGSSTINEFDEISMGIGAYVDYNQLGGQLAVTYKPGWTVGTNIGNVEYPGRDTTAREVMFSVVNASQSSIIIRVGAHNISSSSNVRLRSVYFKKFIYANSFLAQSALLAFRGAEKNNKVELNWELIMDHHLASIVIEKNSGTGNYKPIAEFRINNVSMQRSFQYTDEETLHTNSNYRLKLISANGMVQYSNVLIFRNQKSGQVAIKVFPSVIDYNATLNVFAKKPGTGSVKVVDMSGRLMISQPINIQAGDNNFTLNNLDKLNRGNYVIAYQSEEGLLTQKIIKQ